MKSTNAYLRPRFLRTTTGLRIAVCSLAVSTLSWAQENEAEPPQEPSAESEAAASPIEEQPREEPSEAETELTSEQVEAASADEDEDEDAAQEEETEASEAEESSEGDEDTSIELQDEQPKEEEPPYDGPATLLGGDGDKIHIGGFAGLSAHGTSINKSGGVLAGFEAALLLDHRFAVGVAGYGLSSEVKGPRFADGGRSVLGFGYGGTMFRYHFMSEKSPVTVSVGSLIGAGGLTLLRKVDDFDLEYEDESDANVFFVAEPSLQLHLHMTRWMRVGVGGGYRFVRGPSLGAVEDGDLEGVTAGAHLHFGWF